MPGDDLFHDDAHSRRIREAGRTVLADVLGWSTTAQQWKRIADLVTRVERAVVAADLGAFDEVIADLELTVPVRNNRIERAAADRGGIDDDLRERVNRLQHRLVEEQDAAEREESSDDRSGGRGR